MKDMLPTKADPTVRLFLKFVFCVVCSDYKGWSCLHHAAAGGYTQTMVTLLGSHVKLLDKADDDGVIVVWMLQYSL